MHVYVYVYMFMYVSMHAYMCPYTHEQTFLSVSLSHSNDVNNAGKSVFEMRGAGQQVDLVCVISGSKGAA